jgi:hypothetical protein
MPSMKLIHASMSLHGLSHPFRDGGAVAGSLTGIHTLIVKCMCVANRSCIHAWYLHKMLTEPLEPGTFQCPWLWMSFLRIMTVFEKIYLNILGHHFLLTRCRSCFSLRPNDAPWIHFSARTTLQLRYRLHQRKSALLFVVAACARTMPQYF